MYNFNYIDKIIDDFLNTSRKRHMLGGALLSAALFFGVLALTVITVKDEEEVYDE